MINPVKLIEFFRRAEDLTNFKRRNNDAGIGLEFVTGIRKILSGGKQHDKMHILR